MSKHKTSKPPIEGADVAPDATEPSSPPEAEATPAEPLSPVPDAVRQTPSHVWMPSSEAPVAIGWEALHGGTFRVEVYLTVPEAGAAGGAVQDLIVQTVLGPHRTQVPFSLREEFGPAELVRGTFQLDGSGAASQLWILGLRYPGGYVARHLLA